VHFIDKKLPYIDYIVKFGLLILTEMVKMRPKRPKTIGL